MELAVYLNGQDRPGYIERVVIKEEAGTRTVTVQQRPDLAAAIPAVLASRWPAFMLAGDPGHGLDLAQLLMEVPAHQVLLVDASDQVLGVGLSVPVTWDGTLDGLPRGWDGAVTVGAELVASGGTPTTVSALSVTLGPGATGRGLAAPILQAMKAAAVQAGAPGLLAPVRPIRKPQYPLISMDRYVQWRTRDGEMFDPWLRLHLSLGARMLTIAEASMRVTGTVGQWETWTGLPLPDTGSYIIPGGLVPLEVDIAANCGTYYESNVWVYHS
jgi:hypothetical protein